MCTAVYSCLSCGRVTSQCSCLLECSLFTARGWKATKNFYLCFGNRNFTFKSFQDSRKVSFIKENKPRKWQREQEVTFGKRMAIVFQLFNGSCFVSFPSRLLAG